MMRQTMAAAQQQSAGGGAFSPDDIATLSAWFDASDEATITDTAGAVTQWDDKSANGFVVTPPNASPTTGVTARNSLNVVDFTGGSMRLQTAASAVTYGSSQIFSAFAVVAPASAAILGIVGQHNNSNTTAGPQMLRFEAWDVQTIRVKQTVVAETAGVTVSADTWGIAAGRMTTTTIESYWNGTTDGSTAMSATSQTPVGAGTKLVVGDGTAFTDSGFEGPIAEVIVFAEDLTDAEMNDVGNYLASKWALTWSDL